MAIRQVLADIETKVEALTPVTESTVPFRFVTDFPARGGSDADLAATTKHRRILMRFAEPEMRLDVAGATRVWTVVVRLTLVHVWRREDYQEAEIVRAEDVMQIIECFKSRVPGNASNAGARVWDVVSTDLDVVGDRWITTLTFRGTLGMPSVVAPA